jgi:hypothetical protein
VFKQLAATFAELAVAGVLGVRFTGWDAAAWRTHCNQIGGK